MAWVEKRRASDRTSRYRLRDRMNGVNTTIIRDLGQNKGVADTWKVDFEKAVKLGWRFTPPVSCTELREFLDAIDSGKAAPDAKRVKVAELCDLWKLHYGPSLKKSEQGRDHYKSAYHGLELRLEQLKRSPILGPDGVTPIGTWGKMWADEITPFHVRDLLAPYESPGTKLRWLGAYGAIFNGAAEWNKYGNVVPFKIRLPPYNPFTEWRAKMKPAEKEELPDIRVLEPEEWYRFRPFLPAKARAICEMALRRFMSLSDIRTYTNKGGDLIRERREKSGELYIVPVLEEAPERFDFTDFIGAFKRAQVKAGMDWPPEDRRHFSPKDLRRTGATWGWRESRDLVAIQMMLGHKKITTTQRYLGIKEADVKAVAAAVDAIARGPVGQTRQVVSRSVGAPVGQLQDTDHANGKNVTKMYAMEGK